MKVKNSIVVQIYKYMESHHLTSISSSDLKLLDDLVEIVYGKNSTSLPVKPYSYWKQRNAHLAILRLLQKSIISKKFFEIKSYTTTGSSNQLSSLIIRKHNTGLSF